MIKNELTDISSVLLTSVDIYKAYCGTDVVWEKTKTVYDNDLNEYQVKNYIQAKGYYSYAVTPITGKSTDLIEIGLMVTSRPSNSWCWLIGYSVSESNRFGIYMRNSSGYKWTIDFWRGSKTISRQITTITPSLNKRYDFVIGNPSSTATNRGYAYDIANNVTLVESGTEINSTTSTAYYTVSESRSGKANYVTRYYYVKIYKQANGVKTLVLDWIPVQRVSDGVWGFYDKITKNFYPSEGEE